MEFKPEGAPATLRDALHGAPAGRQVGSAAPGTAATPVLVGTATLHIRIPLDLEAQLLEHAKGKFLDKSEAARDLIRRGLSTLREAKDAGEV